MKIPHMSMAPPALETPSRFAARTGARASPRSRRARSLRMLRRAIVYVLALVVLAIVFMSYFSRDMLFMLATQVWSCF